MIDHSKENLVEALGVSIERSQELGNKILKYLESIDGTETSQSQMIENLLNMSETEQEKVFCLWVTGKFIGHTEALSSMREEFEQES